MQNLIELIFLDLSEVLLNCLIDKSKYDIGKSFVLSIYGEIKLAIELLFSPYKTILF